MDLRDPVTFAAVYAEHRRALVAVAQRVLGDASRAQDVVQDVFAGLWRNPARYDARRGPLGPYLRLVARSRALDVWREAQAAGRACDRLKGVVALGGEDLGRRPEAVAQRHAEQDSLGAALRTLPEPQREALVLAYWGGLTADEIARRTRIPLGTAKSRIRLGLARLRDEVGDALREGAAPLAA
jgi:RNA polymerase sigma-70 factor, ECF subfamily